MTAVNHVQRCSHLRRAPLLLLTVLCLLALSSTRALSLPDRSTPVIRSPCTHLFFTTCRNSGRRCVFPRSKSIRFNQLRSQQPSVPSKGPPFQDHKEETPTKVTRRQGLKNNENALDWVNYGISWVYLAHFASLYVQLPGLLGPNGVSPLEQRISSLQDSLVALPLLPDAYMGVELFASLGMLLSILQIVQSTNRRGLAGVLTYAWQWLLWHDLVVCGGRFTLYQMDGLLLDAAPLTLLAAISSTSTRSSTTTATTNAATFGYQWLLARLYLGAGAVKLLSCDASWRNLSAVHWHLQSQPLPNMVGASAYQVLPDVATHFLTWSVLVVELAAPFLFLAPSAGTRRVAFVANTILMAGIASFGDFGCLQILLAIMGLVLLDDLPAAPGMLTRDATKNEEESSMPLSIDSANRSNDEEQVRLAVGSQAADGSIVVSKTERQVSPNGGDETANVVSRVMSELAIVLAAAGAVWAIVDIQSPCRDTLSAAPLFWGLVTLGLATAILPMIKDRSVQGVAGSFLSLALLAGSVVPLAASVDVSLPYDLSHALNALNVGAQPYGLFAIMTGVAGRPVAALEASYSIDGPWKYVPFLYQVNDPSSPLPLCFPHFPRLDWTLWFVPLGETGPWIQNLFRGIVQGDPAIVNHLLDGPAFHEAFPDGPPEFVRVVPRLYERVSDGWLVAEDPASPMARGIFSRETILSAEETATSAGTIWPSLPVVRSLANAVRPEYFVWGSLAVAEVLRRATAFVNGKGMAAEDDRNESLSA